MLLIITNYIMIEGFIYVVSTEIYSSKNIYKIGCTKNINRRMTELNFARITDDFFKIFLIFKTFNYFFFENIIHNYYKDKKVYNEFYELDNIDKTKEEILFLIKTHTSKISIHLEITHEFMSNNKIKWNGKFFVENEIIMFNSDKFLHKIQHYILEKDKYKLSKYLSDDHWKKIIIFAKQHNYTKHKSEDENIITVFEKLYI